MGTEYYLVHKKSKQSIHCGRVSTFKNHLTESNGIYDYMRLFGVTNLIIVDICKKMIELLDIENSFYHSVILNLKAFDEDDVFILVSENDDLLNETND